MFEMKRMSPLTMPDEFHAKARRTPREVFLGVLARNSCDGNEYEAFLRLSALCTANGLPVSVVSDGLDRVAATMLARAGVKLPIIANHLDWLGADRWRLGFPHAREDCQSAAGHCKCATLTPEPGGLRVLVGDGRSDFCAATVADLVIAKGALAMYCGNNRIPFEPFTDFAGASAVLARWLAALGRPTRPQSEEAAHAPTSA